MNRPSVTLANFVLFLFMLVLSAALQTSFFYWALKWQPNVQLTILILTYIAIYRKPTEGLIFFILASYFMGLMSSMMESVNVLVGILMFFVLRFVRKRVYASGAAYFVWVSLASIVLFHSLSLLVAWNFEVAPPHGFPVFSWILELLLTSLLARPAFLFFVWVDQRMGRAHELELAG